MNETNIAILTFAIGRTMSLAGVPQPIEAHTEGASSTPIAANGSFRVKLRQIGRWFGGR